LTTTTPWPLSTALRIDYWLSNCSRVGTRTPRAAAHSSRLFRSSPSGPYQLIPATKVVRRRDLSRGERMVPGCDND
jgi:hypothetical protein